MKPVAFKDRPLAAIGHLMDKDIIDDLDKRLPTTDDYWYFVAYCCCHYWKYAEGFTPHND